MKKGAATDRKDAVAARRSAPDVVPVPPILPLQRELRQAVLEATGDPGVPPCDGIRLDESRPKLLVPEHFAHITAPAASNGHGLADCDAHTFR